MLSEQSRFLVERAKRIYEDELRASLEASHAGQFVAVEAESGQHFVSATFDGAVEAAHSLFPTRTPHVIRVGHAAALHIGSCS